ncbi:PP2C family protein-serine/threonine phosphatase [Chroococcus sp. FPU101]|uniref:PP2C family protein-serine/threonine phosphatase n=1 Tax=Chroococcus sp. FPU101 TaxID=1974212 RepID=UPI001A905E44|nr:PP2C family protein-serine/threonine phosphatase [Chroococcus sp. FPU101]
MTALPFPHQPSSPREFPPETTSVLALKELVASVYREQTKVQNLLSSLGFALRSFNNLNQFLELTPLMAARVTDADGGALILYKPNEQITLAHLHFQDAQVSQEIRQKLESVIAQVNTSELTQQPPQANASLPDYLDYQIRQILNPTLKSYCTPILVKNIERGRLYVFSRPPQYVWTPTRRKLLQLVADQTAVAIANNELTLELRSKERQDRELEIASDIQLRLLPRKCPNIQGVILAAKCKTANRVGGDYYDFIPTNYDQLRSNHSEETVSTSVPWSIVIGDVMGKGVPAGLIMTMTRGMLRAEVLNRHTPSHILQHLNRVMYADLDNSHRFVTLFYAEYNPKTRILSYSNAAHNPPLIWQTANHQIFALDTKGMLIGLDPDSDYEDAQIQLQSNDTIVYYTDGFTDAMNQNGERFGEERWQQAVHQACKMEQNPQEILDYLFNQVQQFIGVGNNNSDDMTLIVMKIA